MRKIQYTLLILFTLTKVTVAQEISNVTIVADGSAPTKEKALTNALRNAIEKAFGAFILSSTKIENETLLYDEIVSVAQGSIVSYDKMGEVQNSSSQEYTTTISALVSPGKIIAFTKSKGIEVAFKGSVFAQNVLIEQYYKEQEPIILNHFIQSIDFTKLYNYKLEIGDPVFSQGLLTPGAESNNYLDKYYCGVQVTPDRNSWFAGNLLLKIFKNGKSIDVSSDEATKNILDQSKGLYFIPVKLNIDTNKYFEETFKNYKNIIEKICISNNYFDKYESLNGPLFVAPRLFGTWYSDGNSGDEFIAAFRNETSIKIIEKFRENCKNAFFGIPVLDKIKINKGPILDYVFVYKTDFEQRIEPSTYIPRRTYKNSYEENRIWDYTWAWLNYLPKGWNYSSTILLEVGTLDDLQKITSISLEL